MQDTADGKSTAAAGGNQGEAKDGVGSATSGDTGEQVSHRKRPITELFREDPKKLKAIPPGRELVVEELLSENASAESKQKHPGSELRARAEPELPLSHDDRREVKIAFQFTVSEEELKDLNDRDSKTLTESYDRLNQLHSFKAEHGHCIPSAKENNTLTEWFQRLRKWKEKADSDNRPKHFTMRLQHHLETLGFDWKRRSVKGDRGWELRFEELKIFKRKYGHVRVPTRPDKDGTELGRWVTEQRKNRKALDNGELSGVKKETVIQQVAKLHGVGFLWKVK